MKVSVVWTKNHLSVNIIRNQRGSHKESERVRSPWPCLPSARCHLEHGGRERGHGCGERNTISWTGKKKKKKQELQLFQYLGMETE